MRVTHLSLRDFRSYESLELPVQPGVTAFVGPNGQGKTNMLEAVAYLATLDSHRASTDAPLVRAGAQRSVVRASIAHGDRDALAEIEINPRRSNRARLNRSPVSRPREILGVLRVVLFSPDDLSLVKGDPGERRRFLDDTLVARAPRLSSVRADYDRVLKQRNALLKSAGAARQGRKGRRGGRERPSGESGAGAEGDGVAAGDVGHTLDVWDSHLARAGADLVAARLELLRDLRPLVQRAYREIARGDSPVGARYAGSIGGDADQTADADRTTSDGHDGDGAAAAPVPDRETLREVMLNQLGQHRVAELERGVSLVGPHRDDLVLTLGDLPARGYASHGESWSLALALRLAAYEMLRADGIEPVLLLDDVFAELDPVRRERLVGLVGGAEQVLVTAAYGGDVPESLAGTRLAVTDGGIRPMSELAE